MAYSLTTSGLTVGDTLSRNCVPNEGLLGYALSNVSSYISATSWNVGTVSQNLGDIGYGGYVDSGIHPSQKAVSSTIYAPAPNPYEFRKWSLSGSVYVSASGRGHWDITHTVSIRLPSAGRYLAINSSLSGTPVSGGTQLGTASTTASISKMTVGNASTSNSTPFSGTYTYYRIS